MTKTNQICLYRTQIHLFVIETMAATTQDRFLTRTAKNVFSGTMAGVAVCLVGHPFDTLKVKIFLCFLCTYLDYYKYAVEDPGFPVGGGPPKMCAKTKELGPAVVGAGGAPWIRQCVEISHLFPLIFRFDCRHNP